VLLRPTRARDRAGLQALFHRLSEVDVQTRFFQKLRSLTDQAAGHLCDVDYTEEMAFAAVVGPPEHERVVAASSYYVNPRDQFAEVAYMVDPEFRRTGLATALHARTVEYAKAHGVRGLSADVLTGNPVMLRVFRRGQEQGLHGLSMDTDAGIHELEMPFGPP
jgi:RimJ/RimL family protein N-acetyltransferase